MYNPEYDRQLLQFAIDLIRRTDSPNEYRKAMKKAAKYLLRNMNPEQDWNAFHAPETGK